VLSALLGFAAFTLLWANERCDRAGWSSSERASLPALRLRSSIRWSSWPVWWVARARPSAATATGERLFVRCRCGRYTRPAHVPGGP